MLLEILEGWGEGVSSEITSVCGRGMDISGTTYCTAAIFFRTVD